MDRYQLELPMSLLKAYLKNPRTQRALNRKPGEKGFSLIELVVVVAVLAILAAVAIPSFTSLSDDARLNSSKNILVGAFKECEFNEARTGTASHTAIAAAAVNGVTFSGPATGTGCGAAAKATVVSGGNTCVLQLELDTGVKSIGGTGTVWPSNMAAC
jgi:prepilin-type N-terminal cleavage/methylation domain-containing protein